MDLKKKISVTTLGGVGDAKSGLNLTGSRNLIRVEKESGLVERILIDVGRFQGVKDEEAENSKKLYFGDLTELEKDERIAILQKERELNSEKVDIDEIKALPECNFAQSKDIDVVILTHAHIDHIGLIAKLYAEGCEAKVYIHKNAIADMECILEDALSINLKEIKTAEELRKKAYKKLKIAIENVTGSGKRKVQDSISKKDNEDIIMAFTLLQKHKVSDKSDLQTFKDSSLASLNESKTNLDGLKSMISVLETYEIDSNDYNTQLEKIILKYEFLKSRGVFDDTVESFKNALVEDMFSKKSRQVVNEERKEEKKQKREEKKKESKKQNLEKVEEKKSNLSDILVDSKEVLTSFESLQHFLKSFDDISFNSNLFKEALVKVYDKSFFYFDGQPNLNSRISYLQRDIVQNQAFKNNYANIYFINEMLRGNKYRGFKNAYNKVDKITINIVIKNEHIKDLKMSFVKLNNDRFSEYKSYIKKKKLKTELTKLDDVLFSLKREVQNTESEIDKLSNMLEAKENKKTIKQIVNKHSANLKVKKTIRETLVDRIKNFETQISNIERKLALAIKKKIKDKRQEDLDNARLNLEKNQKLLDRYNAGEDVESEVFKAKAKKQAKKVKTRSYAGKKDFKKSPLYKHIDDLNKKAIRNNKGSFEKDVDNILELYSTNIEPLFKKITSKEKYLIHLQNAILTLEESEQEGVNNLIKNYENDILNIELKFSKSSSYRMFKLLKVARHYKDYKSSLIKKSIDFDYFDKIKNIKLEIEDLYRQLAIDKNKKRKNFLKKVISRKKNSIVKRKKHANYKNYLKVKSLNREINIINNLLSSNSEKNKFYRIKSIRRDILELKQTPELALINMNNKIASLKNDILILQKAKERLEERKWVL